MNLLHFSTDDLAGGAAKAAHRLHAAMRAAGHRSRMVVRQKISTDSDVLQAPPLILNPLVYRWRRLRQRRALSAEYKFNFDQPPQIDTEWLLEQGELEVVYLHWITDLFDVRTIRRLYEHYRRPLVWVLADLEPLTGGCHYSFGCDGYTKSCGCCPQLDSASPYDHSAQTWLRKKELLQDVPLCFVAPTSWLADRLRRSSLFGEQRAELIPYPLDTTIFRPFEQKVARDLLHLPQDKKIIFFGATYLNDQRKGMPELQQALRVLAELLDGQGKLKREDVFLLIAGLYGQTLLDGLPFAGKYLGQINEDVVLALAYQAADLFVCPSVEEAGPLMIPEALLCGAPVAAFNTGGAPDVIEHRVNGYLAAFKDSADLARGILTLLSVADPALLREAAHRAAKQRHEPAVVVAQHERLCQSLLA